MSPTVARLKKPGSASSPVLAALRGLTSCTFFAMTRFPRAVWPGVEGLDCLESPAVFFDGGLRPEVCDPAFIYQRGALSRHGMATIALCSEVEFGRFAELFFEPQLGSQTGAW